MFEDVIATHEDLRAVVRPPSRLAAEKVIDHIDPYCRRFIEAAPFVVIASRNPAGFLDLSPKGDPAGVVAPVRGEQAGECRNEVDITVVLNRRRECFDLGRVGDEPEVVTQPLDS